MVVLFGVGGFGAGLIGRTGDTACVGDFTRIGDLARIGDFGRGGGILGGFGGPFSLKRLGLFGLFVVGDFGDRPMA